MDDQETSLVEEFLRTYRVKGHIIPILERLENFCKGRPLHFQNQKRIKSIVFPISYPCDPNNSKLYRNQCRVYSYLTTIMPESKYKILESILDVFNSHFPIAFEPQSPMSQLLSDYIHNIPDYWSEIDNQFCNNENIKHYSLDMRWCFLMFLIKTTDAISKSCWDLIIKLLSDNRTYTIKKFPEILNFIKELSKRWGKNPMVAITFIDKIKTTKLDDIPEFLANPTVRPKNEAEKIIYIMSENCSEVSPLAAKALATITKSDRYFSNYIFQISLYLALLKTVPYNYINTLAQKFDNIILRGDFPPIVAAHIVTVAASCQIKDISYIDHFSVKYTNDSIKYSLFYGALAESAGAFGANNTIPLISAVTKSVAKYGANEGICRFMNSLLNNIINCPIAFNCSLLIPAINVFKEKRTAESIGACGEIVAKLIIICKSPFIMFQKTGLADLEFSCMVMASCLKLAPNVTEIFDISLIEVGYLLTKLCGFIRAQKRFEKYMGLVMTCPVSLPDHLVLIIINGARQSFKNMHSDYEQFYMTLLELINLTNDQNVILQIVDEFWSQDKSESIPVSTIPHLVNALESMDSFESIRWLFIQIITSEQFKSYKIYLDKCLSNLKFRLWYISRVLSILAIRSPNALILGRDIITSPSEFAMMTPALKSALSQSAGPSAMRAAAIDFISGNLHINNSITQYATSVAVAILLENPIPDFTDIGDDGCDIHLNNIPTPLINNKHAKQQQYRASFRLLGRAIENEKIDLEEKDLISIHNHITRLKQPELEKYYLKFLCSLGLRGATYASYLILKKKLTV